MIRLNLKLVYVSTSVRRNDDPPAERFAHFILPSTELETTLAIRPEKTTKRGSLRIGRSKDTERTGFPALRFGGY
jgi:hypothetical protein